MDWVLMAEFEACLTIVQAGVGPVCSTIALKQELAAVVSEFAAMNC